MLKVSRWSRRRKFIRATGSSTRLAGAAGDGEVTADHAEQRLYPSPLPSLVRFLTQPLLATTGLSVGAFGLRWYAIPMGFSWGTGRAKRRYEAKLEWREDDFPQKSSMFLHGQNWCLLLGDMRQDEVVIPGIHTSEPIALIPLQIFQVFHNIPFCKTANNYQGIERIIQQWKWQPDPCLMRKTHLN